MRKIGVENLRKTFSVAELHNLAMITDWVLGRYQDFLVGEIISKGEKRSPEKNRFLFAVSFIALIPEPGPRKRFNEYLLNE